MNGYILLHRKMLDWGWFSSPNTLAVFMFLLLSARFNDGEWNGVPVKTGQVVTGRKAISEATGISEQSVRTAMERLKSTNEITITSTNKFSVITIINWVKYQLADTEPTNKSTNKATNNQPTTNQQLTNNQPQRNKEIKKEGNKVVTARARTRESNNDGCLLSESEMTELAAGIHHVLDEAKRAGFPDTQADWDKGNELVADYGADAVLAAISTCTDRPMDKRNWGYLRGILKSDPTGGKMPVKNIMTDIQRKRKAFEHRRSELIVAGMIREASELRMSDMEVTT